MAPVNEPKPTELAALRERIDRLDEQIRELLAERAAVAVEIGELKRHLGLPIYDPERERTLLERLREQGAAPLDGEATAAIFREIVRACRRLEEPLRVAFLGPEGTFSQLAARRWFGAGIAEAPEPDLAAVAAAVARGEADRGVLPVENSTEGVVGAAYDLVADEELEVLGELELPIHLYLVGYPDGLGAVRRVYSHPQPLRQAAGWLATHLPGVERIEVASTAEAWRRVLDEPEAAAVVGRPLLDQGVLVRLAGPIEDRPDNRTRFWIVGQRGATTERPDGDGAKSAWVLLLPHRPGALGRALAPFAEEGVNLTAITSRPWRGGDWEYRFFVEAEGPLEDARLDRLSEALAGVGVHARLLGRFPVLRVTGEV